MGFSDGAANEHRLTYPLADIPVGRSYSLERNQDPANQVYELPR